MSNPYATRSLSGELLRLIIFVVICCTHITIVEADDDSQRTTEEQGPGNKSNANPEGETYSDSGPKANREKPVKKELQTPESSPDQNQSPLSKDDTNDNEPHNEASDQPLTEKEDALDENEKATSEKRTSPAQKATEEGDVSLSNGKYPEAIKAFRKAIRLKPNDINVRIKLADALYKNQMYDKAIDAYLDALAIDRDNPIARKGLREAQSQSEAKHIEEDITYTIRDAPITEPSVDSYFGGLAGGIIAFTDSAKQNAKIDTGFVLSIDFGMGLWDIWTINFGLGVGNAPDHGETFTKEVCPEDTGGICDNPEKRVSSIGLYTLNAESGAHYRLYLSNSAPRKGFYLLAGGALGYRLMVVRREIANCEDCGGDSFYFHGMYSAPMVAVGYDFVKGHRVSGFHIYSRFEYFLIGGNLDYHLWIGVSYSNAN